MTKNVHFLKNKKSFAVVFFFLENGFLF